MTALSLVPSSSSTRIGAIVMAAGIAGSACVGLMLTFSESQWSRHYLSEAEIALDSVRRHARIEYSHEELRGIVHRGARLSMAGQNQKLFFLRQADDYGNSLVKLAEENAAASLPPAIKAQTADVSKRAAVYVSAAKQATREVFESPGEASAVLEAFEKVRTDFKPVRQEVAHVLANYHAASINSARRRGLYFSIGIAVSFALAAILSGLLVWKVRRFNLLSD
jgi:hypothetical protein